MSDKYRVEKEFLFIGFLKENKLLYENLKKYGYQLVFKPTVKDSHGKPKGNVDAELVLYASAVEFENYDKAVVVSGDGDFACLFDFLVEKKKLLKILIPNRVNESSLLRKFQEYKVFLVRDREKLEYQTNKNGRRSK